MPGPKPQATPRMGGGFNQGMGGFGGEQLDEQAMSQMMQQKALGQQGGAAGTSPKSSSSPKSHTPQYAAPGSVVEEVLTRPAQGILGGLKDLVFGFFDIKNIFGDNDTDTSDQKAKRQSLHQRYQQLDQEQQAVAQKRFQEEMQRKKAEEEAEMQRKQQEQQQKQAQVSVPSSPKKGPVGPSGSNKQKATTKLQQDRQQLNGPGSAN